MSVIELSVKEFNSFVKYLKRLDDLGDDFFLINDIISPSVRSDKNRPGKHYIRSCIPTASEYKHILYGIFNLSNTSKLLGDVKGKKETLLVEQTEKGIWVTANDLKVQLAGIYESEDEGIANELSPKKECFDDYIDGMTWKEIPKEWLEKIKRGDVMTVEDDRNTTYVRIARDLFKLRGVSRLSAPVDFTAAINIVSPESEPDTIVIGTNHYGTLSVYANHQIIEAVHVYLFTPFH